MHNGAKAFEMIFFCGSPISQDSLNCILISIVIKSPKRYLIRCIYERLLPILCCLSFILMDNPKSKNLLENRFMHTQENESKNTHLSPPFDIKLLQAAFNSISKKKLLHFLNI